MKLKYKLLTMLLLLVAVTALGCTDTGSEDTISDEKTSIIGRWAYTNPENGDVDILAIHDDGWIVIKNENTGNYILYKYQISDTDSNMMSVNTGYSIHEWTYEVTGDVLTITIGGDKLVANKLENIIVPGSELITGNWVTTVEDLDGEEYAYALTVYEDGTFVTKPVIENFEDRIDILDYETHYVAEYKVIDGTVYWYTNLGSPFEYEEMIDRISDSKIRLYSDNGEYYLIKLGEE